MQISTSQKVPMDISEKNETMKGHQDMYINNNIWHLHSLSIDESHGYV